MADSANDRVHSERDALDISLALKILRMNVVIVARAPDRDFRSARPIR
jgi:hypothetical protein